MCLAKPIQERFMIQATYRPRYDDNTGLWQIISRSGHVLYASDNGDYVQSVCRELCSRFFTGRPREAVSQYRIDPAGLGR
jgi:hypothetical protein